MKCRRGHYEHDSPMYTVFWYLSDVPLIAPSKQWPERDVHYICSVIEAKCFGTRSWLVLAGEPRQPLASPICIKRPIWSRNVSASVFAAGYHLVLCIFYNKAGIARLYGHLEEEVWFGTQTLRPRVVVHYPLRDKGDISLLLFLRP